MKDRLILRRKLTQSPGAVMLAGEDTDTPHVRRAKAACPACGGMEVMVRVSGRHREGTCMKCGRIRFRLGAL